MTTQEFPPGWNEERVRELVAHYERQVAHYERQTEDEQFAELEAEWEQEGTTMMAVPIELVPEVRALIAQKQIA